MISKREIRLYGFLSIAAAGAVLCLIIGEFSERFGSGVHDVFQKAQIAFMVLFLLILLGLWILNRRFFCSMFSRRRDAELAALPKWPNRLGILSVILLAVLPFILLFLDNA